MSRSAASYARELRFARICQTARKSFDLTQFGSGPLERIGSSFVLGAAFFFLNMLIFTVIRLPTTQVVAVAISAFVSAVVGCAIMILWNRDDAALELRCANLDLLFKHARSIEIEAENRRKEAEIANMVEDDEPPTVALAARPARLPAKSREVDCGYCGGRIPTWAAKCKHCGEYLDDELYDRSRPRAASTTVIIQEQRRRTSPLLAALLSWFIPGLGQLYRGRIASAFLWAFVVIPLAYMCFCFPGVIMHVVCIFDAATGDD